MKVADVVCSSQILLPDGGNSKLRCFECLNCEFRWGGILKGICSATYFMFSCSKNKTELNHAKKKVRSCNSAACLRDKRFSLYSLLQLFDKNSKESVACLLCCNRLCFAQRFNVKSAFVFFSLFLLFFIALHTLIMYINSQA